MRARPVFLRRAAAWLLCLCLLPLAAPAAAASQTTMTVSFSVTTYQNRARELWKLLNAYRAEAGREPFQMTADLESAAIQRAAELFVLFDHVRPDLRDYDTAVTEYDSLQGTLAFGECVSAGLAKAGDVMGEWRESLQEALLDADYTHVGIACVYVKGSENEYYWALELTGQPANFAGKAAADSAKAAKSKNVQAEIAPGMYERADNSHKRFELRVNNLNLKTKKTGTPTVYLYDRYDVKIGRCALDDLRFKSGNPAVFTVSADGTVTRKKAGTGTLTVTAPGLDAAKATVTVGGGSSTTSSTNAGNNTAVTATTIGDRKPVLSAAETSRKYRLSVYVRGASGYVLYRSSTKNGTYTKVTDQATTKRWDYSLDKEDVDQTYYYKARAYKNHNGRKVYSEYSAAVKIAP